MENISKCYITAYSVVLVKSFAESFPLQSVLRVFAALHPIQHCPYKQQISRTEWNLLELLGDMTEENQDTFRHSLITVFRAQRVQRILYNNVLYKPMYYLLTYQGLQQL